MNKRIRELAESIDPIAWRQQHADDDAWCMKFADLIIKDQQRTWVGLTDEEALDCQGWSVSNIARNAEAKLKEKNT